MTRLERKNRTDIIFKGSGGLTDLFDDTIKEAWRISDEEYDYLIQIGTEENDYTVIGAMIHQAKNYSEAKSQLNIINNALKSYKSTLKVS